MPTAEQIWHAFRRDPHQDMHDYSPLLRQLASKCQKILEIGVRDGVSTSAFLLGLQDAGAGGQLWSIDINAACAGTIEGAPNWHFIHGNSQDVEAIRPHLPEQVDLLMIDGDHHAEPVGRDLANYSPLVRAGGMILMHDVAPSFPITPEMIARGWHDLSGVRPAFEDFRRKTQYAGWIMPGRFGLGVLLKVKLLIAILSCQRDRALNQALRETCYANSPWHRFFMGGSSPNPESLNPDICFVDCPDDYEHLAHKTQAMARWALAQGYDYVFKTDADTYVDVARLMRALMEPPVAGADYCGFYKGGPGDYAKGLGYWLSRKALAIVAELPLRYSQDVRNPGAFLAEDRWVGHWLMQRGLTCILDERYRVREPGPEPGNDCIAVHRQNTPEKIHACHRRRQG